MKLKIRVIRVLKQLFRLQGEPGLTKAGDILKKYRVSVETEIIRLIKGHCNNREPYYERLESLSRSLTALIKDIEREIQNENRTKE